MHTKIKKVVILGGGTSGWITAALLIKKLHRIIEITLVESDAIGTIGVGEATIPPITTLNAALDISEKEFFEATNASFKLGIQFEGWGKPDDIYMHTFGKVGVDLTFCNFHHLVKRAQIIGEDTSLWDYSLNYRAAMENKFAHTKAFNDVPPMTYAYHFDAAKYVKLISEVSIKRGVKRIEGVVAGVNKNHDTGYVESLILSDGQIVEGDLFIDCSGFRGILIEQELGVGFEDWAHWLPCDRAVAAQTEALPHLPPYTRSTAKKGGWQWQIPLQTRTGNGLVYSSQQYNEEQATAEFITGLNSGPLTDFNHIKFKTGIRKKPWEKNVVAIGLSSGFLEPLESTSIHLIQMAVVRLIWHFPSDGILQSEINNYNRLTIEEMEHIRDFIIAHYCINQRDDSELWRYCAAMVLPDTLKHKLDLYQQTGKLFTSPDELFANISWLQVLEGQNLTTKTYHPVADAIDSVQMIDLLNRLKADIGKPVAAIPSHRDYIKMMLERA